MTSNGGRALNSMVLPTSLSVNQTCFPSGVAAMSGQNGLSCFTCPTILCSAVATTTVSGLKLEQTYPYFPSGEKIVIPGPFGTVMRVLSLNVWPSRTAIYFSPRTLTQTSLPSGVKNASCGERPTYVTFFTALVVVSMKVTAFEPIETTATER